MLYHFPWPFALTIIQIYSFRFLCIFTREMTLIYCDKLTFVDYLRGLRKLVLKLIKPSFYLWLMLVNGIDFLSLHYNNPNPLNNNISLIIADNFLFTSTIFSSINSLTYLRSHLSWYFGYFLVDKFSIFGFDWGLYRYIPSLLRSSYQV